MLNHPITKTESNPWPQASNSKIKEDFLTMHYIFFFLNAILTSLDLENGTRGQKNYPKYFCDIKVFFCLFHLHCIFCWLYKDKWVADPILLFHWKSSFKDCSQNLKWILPSSAGLGAKLTVQSPLVCTVYQILGYLTLNR